MSSGRDRVESKPFHALAQKFQLFSLPASDASERTSFNRLVQDPNPGAGARQRRFSQYKVAWKGAGWQLLRLAHRPFVQAREHNVLVGGKLRSFEPLEINPRRLVGLTANAAGLSRDEVWHSNVHQIRVRAQGTSATTIVPEGLHRDGHELAALLVIARRRIQGGITRIVSDAGVTVFEGTLEQNTGIVFDDARFLHDTSPIVGQAPDASRDMFIVVFNRWCNARYGPQHEEQAVGSSLVVMED